ncbi:hypothetical protein GOC13_07450 [Sinorhizobium meliloti]|nr:hypothetical protein [Sinorhizobium meliloti]
MAKKTYIVTDPKGVQHTRKTDRVYTHAVVAQRSFDHDFCNAAALWPVDANNFEYSQKIVASNGECSALKIYPTYDAAAVERIHTENANRLERATVEVELHKTARAYQEAKAKERVANVNDKRAKGFYDQWFVLGFCGRRDLAEKLRASNLNGGYYAEAVIIDAHLKG